MNWNDGRVVSNFILQALRGEDLTIYGDGTATRSFQYVHDLVDGLIKLMASDCTEPVNLGTPQEYTIEEFARLSIDLVAEVRAETTKSKIIHLPPVTDDPPKRRPDITRAKERLGWEPEWKVRDGMLETSESRNKKPIYPHSQYTGWLLTTRCCSCILLSNTAAVMAGIIWCDYELSFFC